ncbi:hypothetical protein [Hymenobacter terrenus]|uniref:hypothetical protein n=1 Tax=Hymenobacter terrenus TaxID=1629124 RepID=UPI0012E06AB1|nr:hypothetical protein [Hymenobacter terrenus]
MAFGQIAVRQPGKSIEYVLPAKTTATITRLLAGRTPTYIRLSNQNQEGILLSLSFEPWTRIIPEYRVVLQTGNRFLKVGTKYYAVLFDYDINFYPQKRYIDAIDILNSLDVYIKSNGEYLKYTDWNKGKVNKR